MMRWLQDAAARVYVWALVRNIVADDTEKNGGGVSSRFWPADVRRLAWREINAIRTSIEAHFDYQDREQRILSERLSRRFDLGMAMNEAAQRAISEKQTGAAAMPIGYPTAKQKQALELQQETLQERLRNAPIVQPDRPGLHGETGGAEHGATGA